MFFETIRSLMRTGGIERSRMMMATTAAAKLIAPILHSVTVALKSGKNVNVGVLAVGLSIACVVFNALVDHRLQ